jgi:hypothetical protein
MDPLVGVTLEHLGCREWVDDAAFQRYAPTGEIERTFVFTPREVERDLFLEMIQGTNLRAVALKPRPTTPYYMGEGSGLYFAGVPTISYIPMPNYLLAAPRDGDIDKLNAGQMYEEILLFARLLHRLDEMPAALFKRAS